LIKAKGEIDAAEAMGLRLPRLPKLDRRDVEAVRGFLPGKLLGRTAALLSLALPPLFFAGAVDWMLGQRLGVSLRTMPWLGVPLLVALLLLAVCSQLALEWRAIGGANQLAFYGEKVRFVGSTACAIERDHAGQGVQSVQHAGRQPGAAARSAEGQDRSSGGCSPRGARSICDVSRRPSAAGRVVISAFRSQSVIMQATVSDTVPPAAS
jgi:hypothetical protein